MATTTTVAYGTRAQIDGSNLNSLANGNTNVCSAVDNHAAGNVMYEVDFVLTGTTTPTAGNVVTFYLIQAPNVAGSAGTYTDSVSPGGTAVTLLNATPVKTYAVNATTPFTIADTFLLALPVPAPFWTLAVKNGGGTALAGSGNTVFVTPITYVSA